MVHYSELPTYNPTVRGTIVLPNGVFYGSQNNLKTQEAAAAWIARMKQIYPKHVNLLYHLTKDIKPDPKYKGYVK